ncbi:helix-turn-helix domain-containing protein [uncultured Robinsoniella sp.]|uniref:response regulator transcription factor n=1 Tax=uncultured Robinsoniella sp. TaxID=904190 RepID=UPI00374E7287
MNILIVDDENYVIDSIKKNICWDRFPVTRIYTANSMQQAQTIVEMIPIRIIISDIIMPQGTGLDFVDWVREQAYPIQVIFLTSYAEFEFVKKAIALESVDYLLKPIDFIRLSDVLEKAVEKCEMQQKFKEYQTGCEKWDQNKRLIHENFLKDVLENKYTVFDLSGFEHLDYTMEDIFIPLYLHFYDSGRTSENWDESILEFIIRNVLGELVSDMDLVVAAVYPELCYRYAVILKNRGNGGEKGEVSDRLTEVMEIFMSWAKGKLKKDIWFGAGNRASWRELSHSFASLKRMREENLAVWNCVMCVGNYEKKEIVYKNPHLQMWKTLLEENKTEDLISCMNAYLDQMEEEVMITLESLKKFRMDVVQLIYSYLAGQEVTAHLLFGSKESEHAYLIAVDGIWGAKEFVSHYVTKAVNHIGYIQEATSVVDELQKYIDMHYQEDIRRSDLADLVYLNTDYISRIFKKETGMSISNYLIQKRVEVAKRLLTQSKLPINTVSIHVGYSNFSYFTKMFRENSGCSPLEYRRIYS